MLKVRPAERPDLPQQVAEFVADICYQYGITEQMIRDIRMGDIRSGSDEEGSFNQVTVWFSYYF